MRAFGVTCAVVVAACFDPVLPQGLPCGPGNACPGDLRCIDQECVEDAVTADAPPVAADAPGGIDPDASRGPDGDGDGVLDPDDNCPVVPNPAQYDEDTDEVGDVCDVCPHLPGPQLDGDGDGVGDACDPAPGIGTDQWVDFEGFNAPVPAWTLDTGWQVLGGQLHSPTDVAHIGRALHPTLLTDAYVVSRFTITAVNPNAGGAYRSAAVVSASDGTGEYRCIIRDTPTAATNGALLRDNFALMMTSLGGAVLGSVSTVSLVDLGTGLDCDGATDDGRSWSDQATDATYPGGRVGVRVQHAIATFDYVAVIRPGP